MEMKQKIILFLVIGIGFLGFGLYTGAKQWQFYHQGTSTIGIVTGISKQTGAHENKLVDSLSNKGGARYYPMITFYTSDHEQITFIGQESATNRSQFALGAQVPVIYMSSSPQSAEISDKYNDLLFPTLASVIGLFMLILANSAANRYKLQKILKNRGQKVMADFVGFKATKEMQNNVQGMILICQYQFSVNQPPMRFFSDPIFKKNLAVTQKKIPVYIDAIDKRKYHVDVDSIAGLTN